MTPLYHEINRWMAAPFGWGEMDCVLACADWVRRVTGHDPAEDLRLTYDDAGSCQRATGFLRDPLGVVGPRMARFPVTTRPERGDVALVKIVLDGRVHVVGAVCLGDEGWAIKAASGALTTRAVLGILRAWSIGYAG